jgi:hypothetical protein
MADIELSPVYRDEFYFELALLSCFFAGIWISSLRFRSHRSQTSFLPLTAKACANPLVNADCRSRSFLAPFLEHASFVPRETSPHSCLSPVTLWGRTLSIRLRSSFRSSIRAFFKLKPEKLTDWTKSMVWKNSDLRLPLFASKWQSPVYRSNSHCSPSCCGETGIRRGTARSTPPHSGAKSSHPAVSIWRGLLPAHRGRMGARRG